MASTFARDFFKLYDRKICSGEITFSRIGISKEEFNRICIEKGYVPQREKLIIICERMNLTEEETAQLLAYTEE